MSWVLRLRDEMILYRAARVNVRATWESLVVGTVLLGTEVLVNELGVEVRDLWLEEEENVYHWDSHDVNQHMRESVHRWPFCLDALEVRSDEKSSERHVAMHEQMDEVVEYVSVLVVDSCSLSGILGLVLSQASSRVFRGCPALVRHTSPV